MAVNLALMISVPQKEYSSIDRSIHNFPNSLNDYELGRELGKGAFGKVFQAHLKNDLERSKMAIKIICKDQIKGKDMIDRVKNEVLLHSQLKHKNILQLLHYFEDESNVYLVMELCEKGELYSFLKRRQKDTGRKGLDEYIVSQLLYDIANGIQYLHFKKRIIHRDLKLSNILLNTRLQAKIADFGLAVDFSKPIPSDISAICGTPSYLAPEILSNRCYGFAADMWSLGCLMYALLFGELPSNENCTLLNAKSHSGNSSSSKEALDLLRRLIDKNPDTRANIQDVLTHPFLASTLRTNYIRPMKQKLKYGSIEITPDLLVLLGFHNENFHLEVPDGGRTVTLVSTNNAKKIYNTLDCPHWIFKRFEYIKRFVDLVRSKTPLLILYTDLFKAALMANHPYPDFVITYSKVDMKLLFNGKSDLLTLQSDDGQIKIQNPDSMNLSDINSKQARLAVCDFSTRYKQCRRLLDPYLEKSITSFPIIIDECLHKKEAKIASASKVKNYSTIAIDDYKSTFYNSSTKNMDFLHGTTKKLFLKGIGWCLLNSDQKILLLFIDGTALILDYASGRLAHSVGDSFNNDWTWYIIDRSLPEHIKEKLVHFSSFAEILRKNP